MPGQNRQRRLSAAIAKRQCSQRNLSDKRTTNIITLPCPAFGVMVLREAREQKKQRLGAVTFASGVTVRVTVSVTVSVTVKPAFSAPFRVLPVVLRPVQSGEFSRCA